MTTLQALVASALCGLLTTWEARGQACNYWSSGAQGFSSGSGLGGFATMQEPTGPALFVAGTYTFFPTPFVISGVGRWDGHEWSHLILGLPPYPARRSVSIRALDLGRGPELFALGTWQPSFPNGPEIPWYRRWNGSQWIDCASAMWSPAGEPTLSFIFHGRLRVFGLIKCPDGSPGCVGEWSGAHWALIGEAPYGVNRLINYDDGTGPALYAAGQFSEISGVEASCIARWDSVAWSSVGGGISYGPCFDAQVFDDGTGAKLYLAGMYDTIGAVPSGGIPAGRIGAWDGHAWSNLNGGITSTGIREIYALEVFDDGRGPALYATGFFTEIGHVPARGIARWDGARWEALGRGLNWPAEDLAAFTDAAGPSLFAGGSFSSAGAGMAYGLAQWVGCPNCYANCDFSEGPKRLNVNDFVCFINKYATLDPYANCNLDAAIDVADFSCFMTKFAQGCP